MAFSVAAFPPQNGSWTSAKLVVWPRTPPVVCVGAGLDRAGAIPMPLRLNLIRIDRVEESRNLPLLQLIGRASSSSGCSVGM